MQKIPFVFNFFQMFDRLKIKPILEITDFKFNLNYFWLISMANVFNEVHSRVCEKPIT